MSRIDELIAKCCPNGIECCKLEKLATIDTGKQLNKELLFDSGKYPVMNGGIYPSGRYDEYNSEKNNVAISQGGASAGYVNWMTENFWAGAHCYVLTFITDNVLKKYVYYILKNHQDEFMKSQQGAGIPSLSRKKLNELQVPVPPLAVQEEIVNILDSFTMLEAELEAELEARKKQYEHYRDELLTPENMQGDVNVVKLGEVATLVNGRAYKQEELLSSGKYKVLRVGNFFSSDKWYFSDLELDDDKYCYSGDLLYAWSASFGARIWNGEKTIFHYHIWNIKPSDKVNKKYLMYWLNSMTQNLKNDSSHGATMMHITKQNMEQTSIPIPSLAEQERIVSILDKFDALVNDISDGLPAEINARRQQYEYYRDKLLNFEPMAA